jgi:membrane-associated phospholipid phosphatase
MRLKDWSVALWEAFPPEFTDLAVLVTTFGGAEGLILVVAVCYWFVDRQRGAMVAAYATVGVVSIVLVKSAFALPRPPADGAVEVAALVELTDSEYGFPSGHAFMATLVYGGLLVAFDRLRDPFAVGGVVTGVLAISLSRVFLRVHYLGDIVVGAALGVGVLAVVRRVVDGTPQRGFALAAVIAVPALLVSGFAELALVGLGASLGGVVAITRLDSVPTLRTRLEGGAVCLGGVGYLLAFVLVEEPLVTGSLEHLRTVLFNVALFAGILLLPLAVHLVEQRRRRAVQ